jgi:hypothetical protein
MNKVESDINLSRKDSITSTATKGSNSQYDPDDDDEYDRYEY